MLRENLHLEDPLLRERNPKSLGTEKKDQEVNLVTEDQSQVMMHPGAQFHLHQPKRTWKMDTDQEVRLDLRAADFSQAPYPAELSRSTPVCLHQILALRVVSNPQHQEVAVDLHPLLHFDKDHLYQGNLQDHRQQVLFNHTLTLDKLLTIVAENLVEEAKLILHCTGRIQQLQGKRNHSQSRLQSGKVPDQDL